MQRTPEIPAIVERLYSLIAELEEIVPGRHFTPDGHLVGSIGEALAAFIFDLTLTVASTKSVDGHAPDGRSVEVKATQGNAVGLTADPTPMPDVLLVLQIQKDGHPLVIFNGPAEPVWESAGAPQKNGQRRMGLTKLRRIDDSVRDVERLQVVRSLTT